MVDKREDLNRLFHHFRAQGYEGIIAKDWNGPYNLATRDPGWVKRKPEITLDLVLLAGVFAVTSKENVGLFGSYVIGARNDDGGFDDVGDVAGLDKARDMQIQSEVMRLGLLTGRRSRTAQQQRRSPWSGVSPRHRGHGQVRGHPGGARYLSHTVRRLHVSQGADEPSSLWATHLCSSSRCRLRVARGPAALMNTAGLASVMRALPVRSNS